ncbi:MAG: YHS domain-containing protein [Chitinophagales bacterium]|nr:YHS domain-containing protein [Chitinophagales bacterium]
MNKPMNTKLLIILSTIFLWTITACNTGNEMKSEGAAKTEINVTPDQLASKVDPICDMDVTQSKITDTAQYNGGIYAFCSDHCKEEFKKDPEKYLSKGKH